MSNEYISIETKHRKSDRDGECSLPEDERSEIESELECPVCFGEYFFITFRYPEFCRPKCSNFQMRQNEI